MRAFANIVIAAGVLSAAAFAQQPDYLNPSQPTEKRVDNLISQLTIHEKAALMCTTAPAIDRLRIPVFNGWNQCLRGVMWSEPTTLFPVPIGMAATWNPALIRDVASAISDEARAAYNQAGRNMYWPNVRHNGLVYRSPVINISRDPRWGRIAEVWGEDPFLTSRMGVAYVKGLQGDDPKYLKLAATLKHYAVNNQERNRTQLSAEVPERILMEYWLPHFKAAVVEAHAQSIMSSLNAINGVPAAANKLLLTTILKEQWGFDGFVVPDSGGIGVLVQGYHTANTIEEAAAKGVLAGIDLDDRSFADALPRAVSMGFLSEKDMDASLRRVLRVRFRLGEFDPVGMVPYSKIPTEVIDSPKHRQLALRTARESTVLLSNKNNFLPLDRNKIKTIAVIGPHANVVTLGAEGYTGKWSKYVVPLEGIRNRVSPSTQVLYAQGCDVLEAKNKEASFAEAAAMAKKADVAIVYAGLNASIENEGRDRADLGLPPIQEELIRRVYEANPKTVVVLINGGPLTVKWESQNVPAIVDAFYAGEEGGNAIADVLFGNYNPAGRLPYTVYESLDQLPPMTEYDITKGFTYMYFNGKALYPFGHGLSYTTFQYTNFDASPKQVAGDGQITVRVDVQNTGKRAGDEVVQLYVHDVQASVKRPSKELRGFERVSLGPGERKTASFSLPAEKLSFYDTNKKAFVVEPGAFEVLVESSSEDTRVKGQFEVTTGGVFKD